MVYDVTKIRHWVALWVWKRLGSVTFSDIYFVFFETNVNLSIAGEAKNLVLRNHGSGGQRDVYCTISLDQEEIFRSATAEKTHECVTLRFKS